MGRKIFGVGLVFLVGVILLPAMAQTIIKIQMDTREEGWGTGHSTPSFPADTDYAYCKVEVEIPRQGASLSYTLVLTWYAPDGTVYQTNTWELARDAYYYMIYQRVGKLAIRGTRAAELIGEWRVVASIKFTSEKKTVRFKIVPAQQSPVTPVPPSRIEPVVPVGTVRSPLPPGTAWPEVIAWAKAAVVFIQGPSGEVDEGGNKLYVYGSGVIISSDGYILTAAHVISDIVGEIEVLVGESKWYKARVVQKHPKWDPKAEGFSGDVALLKIEAMGLDSLPIGNSEDLNPEEEVRVLGYPRAGALGLGLIPAAGKALGVRIKGELAFLQIEVSPYDRGHSGGPVINRRGQVVGIAMGTYTSKETGAVHQLAVATKTIKEIVPPSLLKYSSLGVLLCWRDYLVAVEC